jgi:hypothetical protein
MQMATHCLFSFIQCVWSEQLTAYAEAASMKDPPGGV